MYQLRRAFVLSATHSASTATQRVPTATRSIGHIKHLSRVPAARFDGRRAHCAGAAQFLQRAIEPRSAASPGQVRGQGTSCVANAVRRACPAARRWYLCIVGLKRRPIARLPRPRWPPLSGRLDGPQSATGRLVSWFVGDLCERSFPDARNHLGEAEGARFVPIEAKSAPRARRIAEVRARERRSTPVGAPSNHALTQSAQRRKGRAWRLALKGFRDGRVRGRRNTDCCVRAPRAVCEHGTVWYQQAHGRSRELP